MTKPLYDRDFVAWTREQARLLRAGSLEQVDLANVAEEIESLGRSDRRQLESRIVEIIEHLLKLELMPDFERSRNGSQWRVSISKQRRGARQLLKESPSLKALLTPQFLAECYADAARQFTIADFQMLAEPPKDVFTWEEILEKE